MSDGKVLPGIEVVLRHGGHRIKIVAEEVVGHFAIHRCVINAKLSTCGFTITHVPTGLSVWSVEHIDAARKLVEWLIAQGVVPASSEEAIAWVNGLDSAARAAFRASMGKIAPKFDPYVLKELA